MAEYKFGNCPKCNGSDLDVGDCNYSSFNVGWVKCKGCGFKLKVYPCGCFPRGEIAEAWKQERHDYPIRQRALKKLKKLTKAEKRVLGLERKEPRDERYTHL